MAGEITQLRGGAIPGQYLAIADKAEITAPVDRGSTRYTALRGGVLPGRYFPILDKAPSMEFGTARPGDQITKLRGGTLPSAYFTIADKTESLSFTYPVSDTYLVYMSLDPISDDITVITTDTYVPVLSLSGNAVIAVARTDTYVPRLTLQADPPTSSGATPVFAADIYLPVLTLGDAVVTEFTAVAATDTYVPIIAFSSGAGPVMVDQVAASDTYIPVLRWGWTVTPSTQEFLPTTDNYVVRLTMTATASAAVRDVDQIVGSLRPLGVISGRWI